MLKAFSLSNPVVWSGPLLIAVASLLWGTDSLARFPISAPLDPTLIVFIEHLFGVVGLLPWMLARQRRELFALNGREWGAAVFVGTLGSALATTLFTLSFRYVNPSVAVLLQKLQPVLVVLIAYVVLGERPRPKFYAWGLVALGAGIVLSFPDFKFDFSAPADAARGRGILFAAASALLWAFSTVAGKVLVNRISATVGTFWRYVFGLVALTLVLAMAPAAVNRNILGNVNVMLALVYLSFIAGIFPMIIYYAGMKRTPASVVTFIELLYPISSVVLNTLILHAPLSAIELGAGGVLLFAVTMISL